MQPQGLLRDRNKDDPLSLLVQREDEMIEEIGPAEEEKSLSAV